MIEKSYKPVPDVECLKYHGTPEKPDIKIFVSHRIDQDSETIENPLYIPVRCGAVYDEREGITMLGDDTGDNISEKRLSFCELTVQYWAWKNIKADYYGLCHYRRIMAFRDVTNASSDVFNHIIEPAFGPDFLTKYGLTKDNMREMISQYDILSIIPCNLKNLKKPVNVYQSLINNPTTFSLEGIENFVKIFKKKYPDYIRDIDEYFNGFEWRAFNCYILRKEIFCGYNEMLFSVLFELEKSTDISFFNQEQLRLLGYMGEIFFAVYYNHKKQQSNIRCKELPLIRIEHPEKCEDISPAFAKNNIPIVMSSSNEYVPFLSVLLLSIKRNSTLENNYDFIIFTKDIHSRNKETLVRMMQAPNISIRFLNASRYIEGKKLHTSMHITPMTYLRLAIIDVLRQYDKAVYLDCDVVVNSDIAELYATDLEGHYIGAAIDTVMAGWCNVKGSEQLQYNKKVVGLTRKFEYFNAGVIVLNLREIRKDYTSENLFDIALSRKWKWFDQDVLNKICEGKAKLISNRWNVMAHFHDFEYQLPEFLAPYPIFEKYKQALDSPKAIHYAGRFIPCFVPGVDLAEYFWRYARLSPFYELILNAMSTNQIRTSSKFLPDNRTGARKLADKLLPPGTRRREFVKFLLPKGSLRWRFCKQIYYIFRPQYRPIKASREDNDE